MKIHEPSQLSAKVREPRKKKINSNYFLNYFSSTCSEVAYVMGIRITVNKNKLRNKKLHKKEILRF